MGSTIREIDIVALHRDLMASGRTELIHYAGAAHRDPVAWHMCSEYMADRHAPEAVLKVRALRAAYGWTVVPFDYYTHD